MVNGAREGVLCMPTISGEGSFAEGRKRVRSLHARLGMVWVLLLRSVIFWAATSTSRNLHGMNNFVKFHLKLPV